MLCSYLCNALVVLLLCAVLAAPQPCTAGPVEDAATAYEQKEYAKARTLWEDLALKGDAKAMNNLGVLYDAGQGVPENVKEAARWFKLAAEAGHVGGMSNYGRMLEQGRGVERHVGEAVHWFRRAADAGQADAQYNLGVLHERGEGLPQSERDAAAWYSLAASGQQINAQARLGQMYREGKGVRQNATRAVLLLYGAAMNGHAEAVRQLSSLADEEYKGKSKPKISVFGVALDGEKTTSRKEVRAALAASAVPVVREDNAYICDVYNVRKSVPGAVEMAACYGPGAEQPLGFIKIDYGAPDKKQADAIKQMVVQRFGSPTAEEGSDGAMWNMGNVVVAIQYVRTMKQVGLMYMVPRVYHLARQKAEVEEVKPAPKPVRKGKK